MTESVRLVMPTTIARKSGCSRVFRVLSCLSLTMDKFIFIICGLVFEGLNEGKEFQARFWVVAKPPQESRSYRMAVLFLNSAHFHAQMFSFDHDADSVIRNQLRYSLGGFECHPFLNL